MSRTRRLILFLTTVPLLLGTLAVYTPADSKGRCNPPCDAWCCNPYCRHACPQFKHGCMFIGCSQTTGDCLYSAPCS